jgi:hypothetical protein
VVGVAGLRAEKVAGSSNRVQCPREAKNAGAFSCIFLIKPFAQNALGKILK